MTRPSSIAEVCEAIRSRPEFIPVGGGTKPAMLAVDASHRLDMRGLSGILEYQASEYTFTALAGTPLTEIEQALAEYGQYLPFDPPFATAGSTLGGMVASGLNGPGAFRFGGIRDFILGAKFITLDGRLIATGGKVVKNAAGFDIAKFFVGSMGRWGALAEITFKVFPKAPDITTLAIQCEDLCDCVHTMSQLASGAWEFDALEIEPAKQQILARLRGTGNALSKRLQNGFSKAIETLTPVQAASYWQTRADFSWARGEALVKIPSTPSQITSFQDLLASKGAQCVYSIAGNVAWASGSTSAVQSLQVPCVSLRGNWRPALTETDLHSRLYTAFTTAQS